MATLRLSFLGFKVHLWAFWKGSCSNNICTWLSCWHTSNLEFFETETRLAGEWVCSCPKQVLNVMRPSSVIKTDSADSYADFTLATSVGKHQSTTDSIAFKCNMISGNTKAPRVGCTLGSGNDQLWHSKPGSQCSWTLINLQRILDPKALCSRSENTSWFTNPTATER